MNSDLVKLHLAVKEHTSQFKIYFMNITRENIINEYKSLPKKLESLNSKLSEVIAKEAEIHKNYIDNNGRIISMKLLNESTPILRPLWKEREKLNSAIDRCKKLIALDEEKYVTSELNRAEVLFDNKVFALADKLNRKSFSPDNLEFSSISLDPKLFDVYITSGNNRVHARSVLAAVSSECMVTHFRFIITNAR